MSVSPGTRLDGRISVQVGRIRETYRGSCGQVLIKTHLNQSFFIYLETSAIVAKQELKLSVKKKGFSYHPYLEELAWFSCLLGPLNHYYNSKQQTNRAQKIKRCNHFSQNFITVLTPLHTQVFCMYPFAGISLNKSFL